MLNKKIPELYDHQVEALDFIKDKPVFALFMEMGTGKSKVVIEKVYELQVCNKINAVIIISPNAVKDQWVTEQMPLHYPSDNWAGVVWNGLKTKTAKKDFNDKFNGNKALFVFSVNVEAFQSSAIDSYIEFILKYRKCFIVIDESAKIKNGRRKPTRGKRSGAIRTNKILDYFERSTYKCILTGTPTPNNPFDLWSQFEFLKKDFFNMDHFFFTHHHGIMIQKSTNEGKRYNTVLDEVTYKIIKSVLSKKEKLDHRFVEDTALRYGLKTNDIINIHKLEKYSGYKNLKDLREKVSEITFFKKKQDCLDLPDKVYETLDCVMTKDQLKIYKELKSQMYSEYDTKELTVTSKMVMALRLQMITGGLFPYAESEIKIDKEGEQYVDTHFEYSRIENSCKVKVLLDDIENVDLETSIIVWARFRGEIEMIKEALTEAGYTCEKYYGGSTIDVIDRFKNKDIRILIANPLKGGEGLNLQVSTLHYFYSNSFKADSRLQAEDRSHRIGQVNKVTYKDLIVKGSVDEVVYSALKRKENLINYFRTNPRELP